jgi:hypothetical protein
MAAASRESQGMQIATIIFAVLTILLAVTTYIFYAQSEDNLTKKAEAEAKEATTAAENVKLRMRSQVLQYVIGEGVDKATVDSLPTSTDAISDKVLKQFNTDMAIYAAQAGADGANNYRVVPAYLLGIINAKQTAMVDSSEETKRVQAKSTQDLTAEQGRTQVAEAGMKKAQDDLGAEKGTFAKDRTDINTEKERIAAQLLVKDQQLKKEREDAAKTVATITGELNKVTQTNAFLKEKVVTAQNAEVNRFEAPDGRVTLINQSQRLVWINLGQADGLMRQTTFSVFDHDENGVANAEPKARLEVVRIVGDHLAECRILEDKPADPILQNDVIFTPAWSPGMKVHFALVGFMDINKDSVSDRDMIRNFIKMSGGVIDAELQDDGTRTGNISVNTRYLVLGEKPTDKSGTRMLQEYNFLLQETSKYGTETINVQKLMSMMGVKPEERKVDLGTNAGKNEFKKRTPARPGTSTPAPEPAAAPAPGPMPAAPMPAAPPVDPFG